MKKKVLLLGSGELGKELSIALARLGIEVVACDRYDHAPAMTVTPRRRVLNMLNADELRRVVIEEQPDLIVPEIEAIATSELVQLELEGFKVIPSALAVHATMNRRAIRNLAAETLKIPTAKYLYASCYEEFEAAALKLGFPCFSKPLMSSSGKGQSLIHSKDQLFAAWKISQSAGRSGPSDVILEEFVAFEHEITLLTIRAINGTFFAPPIGHIQESGDYIESWQPHPVPTAQLKKAQAMAKTVTDALGGHGLFGVELFLRANGEVIFSELSPRPHDTGLVTLASGPYNEFYLHALAILGLPITSTTIDSPAASLAFKSPGDADMPEIDGLNEALAMPGIAVRVFGKPEAYVGRRLAVVLARAQTIEAALKQGRQALAKLSLV